MLPGSNRSLQTFHLIIFDVDGTLTESFTLRLLPGVEEFFDYLRSCDWHPKLAIATNQGGVGLGYSLILQGSPKAGGYPTSVQIEERMRGLLQLLEAGPDLALYISFRYQDRSGNWTPLPPESETDPRWLPDWRKPGPGMLLQAMHDAQTSPEHTLFVGDSPEDKAAAEAAGCSFLWANIFFNSDWPACP